MMHIPKYLYAFIGGIIGGVNAVMEGHFMIVLGENLNLTINWNETFNYGVNVFLGGIITLWLRWMVKKVSDSKGKSSGGENG